MFGWLACSAPCCLSSGASGRCGCSLFWDPVTDHPCSRVTSALITLAGGQSGGSGERRRPRHTGCLLRRQARPALRWAVLACAATCCVHAHTHTMRGRVEGGWHPKMHGWSSAHRHPRSILLMPISSCCIAISLLAAALCTPQLLTVVALQSIGQPLVVSLPCFQEVALNTSPTTNCCSTANHRPAPCVPCFQEAALCTSPTSTAGAGRQRCALPAVQSPLTAWMATVQSSPRAEACRHAWLGCS